MKKNSRGKKILLTILGSFGLAVLVGWVFWLEGIPQRWWENHLKARLIRAVLAKIEPLLPFEIESLDVNSDWASIRAGRIQRLTLVIRRDQWRARLVGPLELTHGRKSDLLALNFNPDVELEDKARGARQELQLALWVESPRPLQSLAQISAIGAQATLRELTFWPGVASKKMLVEGLWEQGALSFEAIAPEVTYTQSEEKIAQITQLKIQGVSPAPEAGVQGRALKLLATAQSAETLWGDLYFRTPLTRAPLVLESDFDFLASQGLKGKGARIKLGRELEIKLTQNAARFKLDWIPIAPYLALARGVPAIRDAISGLDLRDGKLNASGGVIGREHPRLESGTRVQIQGVALEWPSKALAAKELALSASWAPIPLTQMSRAMEGELSVGKLSWKRFRGAIEPTKWKISEQGNVSTPGGFNLKVSGFPVHLGSLVGQLLESKNEDEPPAIGTSIQMPYVPVQGILNALCIGHAGSTPTPPFEVRLDISRLWWGGDWLEIYGSVTGKLFGGDIRLDEIAVYDLNTPVPETNFNLGWERISLKGLGEWLGFGEMDGKLKGFAQDVVMQEKLPTRFYFRTEVEPDTRGDVVFSPEAMKNFVRLFAGNDLAMLPGTANWLAFGWPSRVFGGYDVMYAGISVVSSDGGILVETLDPPKIVEKERRHFIIYGPRFKMPLQTSRYPLVLDAASMGNFVNRMFKQLETIAENSRKKEGQNEPPPAPEQSTSCRYRLDEL